MSSLSVRVVQAYSLLKALRRCLIAFTNSTCIVSFTSANFNTQRGISFSVHDKVDPATRHRNWSMTVYWAFRYYPQLLPTHLQERLNEGQARSAYRYTENEWLIIQNCKTGEVLKEWNSPYGIRVNRAGLRKLFLDGIDVKVRYPLHFHKEGTRPSS